MKLYTKSLIAAWIVAIGIGQANAANNQHEELQRCMYPYVESIAGDATNSHEVTDAMIANIEGFAAETLSCASKFEKDPLVLDMLALMLTNTEGMKTELQSSKQNQPVVGFDGRLSDDLEANLKKIEAAQ